MVDLTFELQRLQEAKTTQEFVDAVWDLRDSAYDKPNAWTALTAEAFFQVLAEVLEASQTDGEEVPPTNRLLAQVLSGVLAPPTWKPTRSA